METSFFSHATINAKNICEKQKSKKEITKVQLLRKKCIQVNGVYVRVDQILVSVLF